MNHENRTQETTTMIESFHLDFLVSNFLSRPSQLIRLRERARRGASIEENEENEEDFVIPVTKPLLSSFPSVKSDFLASWLPN